jgi:hypothetical protein
VGVAPAERALLRGDLDELRLLLCALNAVQPRVHTSECARARARVRTCARARARVSTCVSTPMSMPGSARGDRGGPVQPAAMARVRVHSGPVRRYHLRQPQVVLRDHAQLGLALRALRSESARLASQPLQLRGPDRPVARRSRSFASAGSVATREAALWLRAAQGLCAGQ